ncbi:bublin coiled-coil protein-like [Lycaon pictus]
MVVILCLMGGGAHQKMCEVLLFRRRVPSRASTFHPAPAVRGTLAAPEPAKSGPNGDLGLPVEAGAEGEDDGFGEAEYAAINSMLDQVNSCLDHLEEKNDHLHARLQELLESNWQTRLEFQQQLGEAPPDASP